VDIRQSDRDAFASRLFCKSIAKLARVGKSAACDKFASAGGLQMVMEQLVHWHDHDDWKVVHKACKALETLACNGSEAVKGMMRSPNIVAVLRTLATTYKERRSRIRNEAASTLTALGVPSE
jgi:hypothetical protein